MRVYLLGYMGSGKSRFGRMIAQATSLEFLDLDELFESRFKIGIADFFGKYDEKAFRQIERALLTETFSMEKVIISTGGGTPCYEDNMDLIKQNGFSIYLQWSVGDLQSNILKSRKTRPLLINIQADRLESYIHDHLSAREPFYLKADMTVPLSLADMENQLRMIINRIRQVKDQGR